MKTAFALGALALLTALADSGSAKHQDDHMRDIADQAVSDARSSDDGDRLDKIESRLDAVELNQASEGDAPAEQ